MRNNYRPKTQTQISADKALKDMFSVKKQTNASCVTTYSKYSGPRRQYKKKESIYIDLKLIAIILLAVISAGSFTYSFYTNFVKKPEPRIIEGID
jgi:hypothetical protein